MVELGVARKTARLAARSEEPPDLGVDLPAIARALEPAVIAHTGLTPQDTIPPLEIVSRAEWAAANVATLGEMLEPITGRLDERIGAAGFLAPLVRAGAGIALGTQVGLLSGYLAQHVLGQYEVSLLASAARPRLLMVATNLDRAALALQVDRESFLRWVTIHELVHALQFGGVPWLRDHLGGLLREYIESLDVEPTGSGGRLPSLPHPADLVARVREGGLGALVQSADQRRIMERVQATMAVVEGHAEHVMDALAPALVPEYEGLRAAMERRRESRAPAQRLLMRLLGMEMKMRQYRDGKAFCDAVVAGGGSAALADVWRQPAALPSLEELGAPDRWLERVASNR